MASNRFDTCGLRKASPTGAILPNACAMISLGVGHREKLLFTLRVAAHSAPMMGINRSNLSRRTLLFLFVLLGAPLVARSATLEDSAKELARKIATSLPARTDISLEIRNSSSLMPEEVSRIAQVVKAELQNLGTGTPANGVGAATVVVTLSESLRSYVWAAEIHFGDASQVVFTTLPRSSENRRVSSATPLTLRSEKFWEGQEVLLDAAIANSSGGDSLLLLVTPNELLIRKLGSDAASIVPFPPAQSVTRDPTGYLIQDGNRVTVKSMQQICDIDLEVRTLIECRPAEAPPSDRPSTKIEEGEPSGPVQMRVQRDTQTAAVQTSCRPGALYLAAGRGDYTEPDTIGLFESNVADGVTSENPLSDLLHFAGPVMALQSGGAAPRAIVHNLRTGNYEAFRILISCGQ
jgi:hypothetical protein